MPELPEVEVTRRGIAAQVAGQSLQRAILRVPALRYPVPPKLARTLAGRPLIAVKRRGKYLLLDCDGGHLLIHLGMSGSLRFVTPDTPPQKHDHADFQFDERVLRFTDPRRFGALLWLTGDPLAHPLLAKLGIEPLTEEFSGAWLQRALRGLSIGIKPALMDGARVVGVGNIYASESLFDAGIDPRRAAGRVSRQRLERLVPVIQTTLEAAIAAGGSSLRDFCGPEGMGDFQMQHKVYGRSNAPCVVCGTPIRTIRQGQRSTFFCTRCQR